MRNTKLEGDERQAASAAISQSLEGEFLQNTNFPGPALQHKTQARSPRETHLGPRADSAPQGYRSSHPCVHHPPWAKAPGNASQEKLGSLPSEALLPPPPWHERDRGCSMHKAAFDIRPAVGRPGKVGGATQPAGQIVLALSGLGLGSSSSLPFDRLLHAYQAVAHSSHSRIQTQFGSCEGGQDRGGQRASWESRVSFLLAPRWTRPTDSPASS